MKRPSLILWFAVLFYGTAALVPASMKAAAAEDKMNAVEVIAADKPGIVHHLVEFFGARGILIDNFASTRYTASQTGTDMFSAHLAVSIPSDLHIAALRDEFMEFCDGLNLDAIIEPIKN